LMLLYESVEKKVVIQEKVGVLCNQCGEVLEIGQSHPYQSFDISFGYGSYDNKTLKFELCNECINEMVKGFKLEPEVTINDVSDWEWPMDDEESVSTPLKENTYED